MDISDNTKISFRRHRYGSLVMDIHCPNEIRTVTGIVGAKFQMAKDKSYKIDPDAIYIPAPCKRNIENTTDYNALLGAGVIQKAHMVLHPGTIFETLVSYLTPAWQAEADRQLGARKAA